MDQPSNDFAVATLHHRTCRPSAWHGSGVAAWPREPYLTYSMGGAVIQFVADGGASDDGAVMSAAVVLLNPSLEQHVLRRVDGRWISCGLDYFETAGLLPPTEADGRAAVAPGVRARVTTKTIFVDVPQPRAARTFNGAVGAEVCRAALQAGRLLLIVTQAVNPTVAHGPVELNTMLTDARARMGWVAVAG